MLAHRRMVHAGVGRGMDGQVWFSSSALQRARDFILCAFLPLPPANLGNRLPSWPQGCPVSVSYPSLQQNTWDEELKRKKFILDHNFKALSHLAPSSWTCSKSENWVGNTGWRKVVPIMVTRKTSCFYNSLSLDIIHVQTPNILICSWGQSLHNAITAKRPTSLWTLCMRTKPSTCGTQGPFKLQVIVSRLMWSESKREKNPASLTSHLELSGKRSFSLACILMSYSVVAVCVFGRFVKTPFKHITHCVEIK